MKQTIYIRYDSAIEVGRTVPIWTVPAPGSWSLVDSIVIRNPEGLSVQVVVDDHRICVQVTNKGEFTKGYFSADVFLL